VQCLFLQSYYQAKKLMSLLDKIKNADYAIFSRINGEWHNTFLDTFLPFLRQSYLWIPFYFFLLIFAPLNFKKQGWYWSLFFIITAVLSDYISSTLIKGTVLRLRPCQDPALMHNIRLLTNYCPGNSAFTSSHAANHFAVAMYIFTTFKKPVSRWWALLFIWAAVISYTQVYVGVHFPGDVIGGAFAGVITGYLPAKMFNKYIDLYKPETR
jgi:membrane-associated phospholipid phosphatase